MLSRAVVIEVPRAASAWDEGDDQHWFVRRVHSAGASHRLPSLDHVLSALYQGGLWCYEVNVSSAFTVAFAMAHAPLLPTGKHDVNALVCVRHVTL